MPQPKFAPGPRGGAYTEADDFNMQIEHVNNEFFLDKWAGGGWTNISVHKTYADALAARNEIMKFLRSGAAEDVVTATDSRERPATIKESLTVHDCFGWAWEDAGGQWVFVKNSPGQEHAIACHAAALKEIKIDQPQAQPTPSPDDIHSCSEFCDLPECVAAREAQAQGEQGGVWLAKDGAGQLFIVLGNGPHDVYGGEQYVPLQTLTGLQAERDVCEQQADYWQGQAADLAVALAQHRAALEECVGALEEVNEWRKTGVGRPPEQTSMDAITHANQVLGRKEG